MRSETKANFKPQTKLIPLCTDCAAHSPHLSLLLCISAIMPKKKEKRKKDVYLKHIHISLIAFTGGGVTDRYCKGHFHQNATFSPIYVVKKPHHRHVVFSVSKSCSLPDSP